ncbi:BLOC-1-related complex subunit 6-like [Hydra vulgaris]|uniref:BLOC-1-related complex subunit 6-like n=1 Tax=Hydra vulgaris TaxID=6087 RepID=A0ABM4DN78_HYDVU
MAIKVSTSEEKSFMSSSSEEELILNTEKSYISSSSEEDMYLPCTDHVQRSCGTILPTVDPTVIKELEEQAKHTQVNLEKMILFLSNELRNITKISLESVETYCNTISNTHTEVESSIRSMYGLIAKCEELDQKMKPVAELALQVQNIKQSVDILEQLYNS